MTEQCCVQQKYFVFRDDYNRTAKSAGFSRVLLRKTDFYQKKTRRAFARRYAAFFPQAR